MINLYIQGQTLKIYSPVIAADSLRYLEVQCHFDESWAGASKWVHFRQEREEADIVYDFNLNEADRVEASAGVNLSIGEWETYITGTIGESRLTTVPIIITVKESGLIDAPLHEMPLTVAEQIDAKAATALLMAQAVKNMADNGELDGPPGPQGEQGERGPQGIQGIQGIQGEPGPQGAAGPRGPQGIQGPKGDTGKGLEIKGRVVSIEELPVNAAQSEFWNVGTEPPYNIYMFNNGTWEDQGQLQGASGADGKDGVIFTPNVDEGGNLTWTNDGGLDNPAPVNIRGPQGLQGVQGEPGPQGEPGRDGAAGSPGAAGKNGVIFTPSISESGMLSWENDGGLDNPAPVNIMGPQGVQGPAGANGKSPYEYAVAGGYTGTEATFMTAMTQYPYHHTRHEAGGADPITVSAGMIASGAVTRAKLGADAKPLAFTNKTIATSAWASNNTYSGFGFRASVACSGVTANFCPFVIFSPADAQSGKFAPVAVTYSGGVYIYASSKPTATVTIPTILCIPTQ